MDTFRRGDIVYCKFDRQTYVFLSMQSNDTAYAKSLTNLDAPTSIVSVSQLELIPPEDTESYCKLEAIARSFV